MLTSQGDQQQIYVRHAATPYQALSVLNLSQSVDDTAWAAGWHGRLYATDNGGDKVDVVTGSFRPGTAFVALTPCGSNSAGDLPGAPTYPANYLGLLNMSTGQVSPVTLHGAALHPQGPAVRLPVSRSNLAPWSRSGSALRRMCRRSPG